MLTAREQGFAKDRNLQTVCGTVEAALQPFSPYAKVNVVGAGRTDRGVHASRQVPCLSLLSSDELCSVVLYCALHYFAVRVT